MGQKVNPISFRLPIRRDWAASWCVQGNMYSSLVKKDHFLREFISAFYKKSSFIARVAIERSNYVVSDADIKTDVEVFIYSSNVGAVIGKGSKDIEKLKLKIKELDKANSVKVHVIEIKRVDTDANLIALNIAAQLNKRMSFKRVSKKALENARKFDDCLGIKIACAGRLGGAEIAKTETFKHGSVPLHTLNANVQYGFAEANTTYGIIGVKVWVYLES